MKKSKISIIVAVHKTTNTIGTKDNKLPWYIPADLRNFKKITTGHPIIMGRKTWEMFGGKPLPDRKHIVVSTNPHLEVPEGVTVCHSIAEAIEHAYELDSKEVFIIGGAEIYRQTLPFAGRLYITEVDGKLNFDTAGSPVFPNDWKNFFKNKIHEEILPDEKFKCEFFVYDK